MLCFSCKSQLAVDVADSRASPAATCVAGQADCAPSSEAPQSPSAEEPAQTPPPPVPFAFLGLTGSQSGTDLSFQLSGTAAAETTVSLYANADCSGSPAQTLPAEDFKNGVSLTVALAAVTRFSATTTDKDGLVSDCVEAPVTYTQLAWTWQAGPTVKSDAGHYGVKGVASPDNYPPARSAAVTLLDSKGNLWLYGGNSLGGWSDLNDLWKHDKATGLWTWVAGSSSLNPTGNFGTLGVADAANTPCSHAAGSGWVDADDNLYFFGGMAYKCITPGSWIHMSDLWKFDPETSLWTWLGGSDHSTAAGVYGTKNVPDHLNQPGGRMNYGIWQKGTDTIWIYGGEGIDGNGLGGDLADLWSYDIPTGVWTWLGGSKERNQDASFGTLREASASNLPGSLEGGSTWRDTDGNLWLFGGNAYIGGTRGLTNTLWKYDISTGLWTWMQGSNTLNPPAVGAVAGQASALATPGGIRHSAHWTDSNGDFWIYGGSTSTGTGGLWRYSPASGQWLPISDLADASHAPIYGDLSMPASSTSPGSRTDMSAWVDGQNRLWMFGGSVYTSDGTSGKFNDLWSLPVP